MTDISHKIFPTRLAITLTYIFHPFALPIFLALLLRFDYLVTYGISFLMLLSPAFVTAISLGFYRNWRQKPVFKKMAERDPGTYHRIVVPLAFSGGAITKEIFSWFLGGLSSLYLNSVLVVAILSLAVRYFYNISLQQVSIGLLGMMAYGKFSEDPYHIAAMAFLTMAVVMIRAQYYLKEHNLVESLVGLGLGAGVGYFAMSTIELFSSDLYIHSL